MKLLVTGGAGFIGSNFIRYWLKKYPNDKIVNLDKLTYAGHLSSTKDFSDNPKCTFIKGDICSSELVHEIMKAIDIVVHFAAESHVDRSIVGPATFVKTNILGTQVLLDAAVKNKVKRFHHVSTDEVFGSLPLNSKAKFSEKTIYDPKSPYSASKAASDHLVRAYHNTYGLDITITNTSNNYGPYQDPEKFLPRMITNLIDDKEIPIYGDGKYVRDWIYVEDHCRAIDIVLQKAKVGETYLVGGLTKDVNNLQIAKKLLKIFRYDESYLKFVKDRPGHDRRYAVNWSKIKLELGWKPKYDFDTWLERTVEWYKYNEWWWRPIKKEAEKLYAKTGQK
ncbi:dTDP-glucose 4,6-dehydratase [Candidatus Woesebacteria bacterium RIFCSPHIGHO2_01_FULL_39_32]|uniref:dTDP-glucose 4,6-dehydratase n=2 Tax=Candidatus Woeseibacteriota TaxID=1752722 RepID=A0A0G0S6U1_9BACT|nr:MAG: dTDP-glucose 4,6-dehydratase [Candidatus Woesebacteria bacterium GW2011_GWA1_39_8]OGM04237.1 MAG: dTDP-glucose 4,6-dehydratase [Candidatus Woesebacteria bacterium GWB1_37_5]OGM25274.1 MAG: dTDP-glucose 4,6-dehydratase [Candidatus Woesebacteria bacterium RIFCSPHIGHO2_01_FULL_39_32]OGM37774.1 MAG: dTDP-glucose 4,6-dehydratase [Candidatus Woesebacteria bacterium RIFCSPHIGHO2_12_FULL_38_11]OGM64805.1 MAG: dTDP-glucose 4,6-dehydratase [Candidatus Woesebacteria bacterium RIFCSPLOWO2_01_FULL_3